MKRKTKKTKAARKPDFNNIALLLNGRLDAQIERIETLERRVEMLDRERAAQSVNLRDAREQLSLYRLVFGPVWKTQAGFHVVPALMSDNHLANMVELGFGSLPMQQAVRHEQKRREEDDQWYARKGKLSPRQLARKVEELDGKVSRMGSLYDGLMAALSALRGLVR